jgi:hypothetical protein
VVSTAVDDLHHLMHTRGVIHDLDHDLEATLHADIVSNSSIRNLGQEYCDSGFLTQCTLKVLVQFSYPIICNYVKGSKLYRCYFLWIKVILQFHI